MRFGNLRERVVIQEPTVAVTGTGNARQTWSTYATTWARFDPRTGVEQIRGGQVDARVPTNVVMRYRAGVTTAMRLVFGSRIFQIQSVVDVDERHRELNLVCLEQV